MLITNEPGEIKPGQTNQTKLAKKGKTFYFTYKKGANWVLSSQIGGRGILKDHICVFHGTLGNGLLWDNISRLISHFLQRRLLPLHRSFSYWCYKSLLEEPFQIHLKLTFMFKNTTNFIFTAELCDQCQGLWNITSPKTKGLKKKKKGIEQWSDTIHTSIKTDFHSWFIYYLVLKNCNQQPNIFLKVQWEDLRNRQNNNKLKHIINISNKDWWINIIFFWRVVIFLVSSLSFLLFTLLLDKWGSFPEPACCDTNLRSSLVTCLLPRIFRNTWTQQPGLGFYGSEMHTDEHTHTHRHTNAFINTHL